MKNVLARLIATALLLVPSIAIAQDTTVWVGNRSSHSISIIDIETDDVLFHVKPMCCIPNTVCNPQVGNTPCILGPHDIAFSPNGQYAFVTAYDGDRLAVFDTTPLPEDPPEYIGRISVGDRPQGIVVDPEGTYAYVSISGEDKVQIFLVSEGFPLFYDEVEVMDDPNGIDITPDGTKVYVANNGSGTVSVIDTTYLTVETIAQVDAAPRRVVIGDIPGVGLRAYTCNATGDNVSVMNATTDAFITEIMLDDDDTPQTSRPRGIGASSGSGHFSGALRHGVRCRRDLHHQHGDERSGRRCACTTTRIRRTRIESHSLRMAVKPTSSTWRSPLGWCRFSISTPTVW